MTQIKARFLAKEYMEKKKISSKEEIEGIIHAFDKLNDVGIKTTNFALFLQIALEIIVFCMICLVR